MSIRSSRGAYKLNDCKLVGITVAFDNDVFQHSGITNAGSDVIEYAARLCYNSHDKMHSTTTFLPGLIRAGHMDVFEHASFVLRFVIEDTDWAEDIEWDYDNVAYTDLFYLKNDFPYIQIDVINNSTNLIEFDIGLNHRSAYELLWAIKSGTITDGVNDLTRLIAPYVESVLCLQNFAAFDEYYSDKTHMPLFADMANQAGLLEYNFLHEYIRPGKIIQKVTANNNASVGLLSCSALADGVSDKFRHMCVTINGVSRAFTHQHVRHRLLSHSQMSQRYVDYSKQVGDHTLMSDNFVFPDKIKVTDDEYSDLVGLFNETMRVYEKLRSGKIRKEDARAVLPNAAITHIVSSAYNAGWEHYFNLRTAKDAQQEIREVALACQSIYNSIYDYKTIGQDYQDYMAA